MQTLRHIGRFVKENEQIIAQLDNLGLDYDIVPFSNMSFRDSMIERPSYYTYGLDYQLGDNYLSIPEVAIPEKIMWCDCHKHRKIQNKVLSNLKDITRTELNTIWGSNTRYTLQDEIQKQFPHSYGHQTEYISHSVCRNHSLDNSSRTENPNKWHLKAIFFDLEGNPYETWFYPDDLVVRIPFHNSLTSDNKVHLGTLSTWETYRGMEDYGTMSREDFDMELSTNWNWDIDNPKVCFAENCKQYHEYEDYLPNMQKVTEIAYQNALENLQLQMQFARFYRRHEHGFADDTLEDLNESIFSNIFDDSSKMMVDISRKSIVEMCKDIEIKVKSYKTVTDDDVATVLMWLDRKIHHVKQARKSNKSLVYLIENILEQEVINKDNIDING